AGGAPAPREGGGHHGGGGARVLPARLPRARVGSGAAREPAVAVSLFRADGAPDWRDAQWLERRRAARDRGRGHGRGVRDIRAEGSVMRGAIKNLEFGIWN